MTYSLTWQLGIFALSCETTASHTTLTEGELRAKFGEDATLNRWADFAQDNPGAACVYDMLPV